MEQLDWRSGDTMGFCTISEARENPQKFGHIRGTFNGPRFLSMQPFGHGVRIGA